jgi:hypothetical protein
LNPLAEFLAVSREMEIVRRGFDLHRLANQPHAVRIRLQEADVRVAIDGKAGGGVRGHQRLNVHGWNPRRGNDDVCGGIALQSAAQVLRADNRPNISDDVGSAQNFAGVQRCNAKSDVADVLMSSKILVGEDESLRHVAGWLWIASMLTRIRSFVRAPIAQAREKPSKENRGEL